MPLPSHERWGGLQEGLVGFLLSHLILLTFFLVKDAEAATIIYISAVVVYPVYLGWRSWSSSAAASSGSQGTRGKRGTPNESELQSLLEGTSDDSDDQDHSDDDSLGAGCGAAGKDDSFDVGGGNPVTAASNTILVRGNHQRFGTPKRAWPGFEDDDDDDDDDDGGGGGGVGEGDTSTSSWSGLTSKVKPQRWRTISLRVLSVTLSAATPYYLLFLCDWMRSAFGLTGLVFAIAEALACACRAVYWLQLWCGQWRRVRPMAQLTPPFPEHQWPQVEVVIAHYQEPCEELAATLRAALDLDYPPERLIVSIIDDGYFKRHEAELPHHETVEEGGKDGVNGPRFEATAGGKAVVEMMRATYARFGDRFNTNRSGGGGTTISEVVRDLAPARHAVPGCDQRAGSLVLEFRKPGVPLLRLVARRKAKDSYFKGGNLNNALYNVFDPHSSFMVILDADMVPAEDFLQLSLPLFFEYDADAPPLQDNNADGDDFNHNQSPPPPHRSFPKKKKEEHGHGRWVCPWSVAMVASPQHYRNLDSNGSEDDPLNQRNESYTRRLQQRMDSLGLVHFCGTNTTFFIPALRDTLGFVTGLLSEDTPTGFDLARLGWDCFFVDQALATGTVKESASETMLQRFRWMGGNGLMYLFHKRFGSQGFLTHGPAQARAQRIQSLQNNTTEMQQQHGQQQEQRQHHGDSTQMSPFSMNSLVNTTNTSSNADPAFSSSLVLSLPADNDIAATYASSHAHSYPASAPSFSRNSRRLSASPSSSPILSPAIMAPSSSLPAINAGEDPAPASPPSSSFTSSVSSSLLAVGTHDAGLAFRRQSNRHWLRRVVLWSVYDVGMGYMFTSTFWHAAFHAVMFDSLVFSDGERLVTMQPLFGVLYSLGSFGVLLSLGPTEQVLRVLNEWFAWAWLKAIAAGHVLDFSRSQKPDPPLDDGYFFFGAAHDETGDVHGIAQDSVERSTDDMTGDEHSLGGGQGETAAKDGGAHTKMALRPYRTKSRTAPSLVVETKSSSSSGSSSSSSQVRRQSEGINGESSPITPLIRSRRGGCNGKSGDAVGRVGESEKGKGDFVMEPPSPSLTSTLSAAANAVANHVSYSGSSSSSKRTHAPAPNSPKTPASPSSSSASGAAASSSGSWNAGVGFRLWLLVPPMLYYCLVLTMLVWTLFFGAAGQSMLHDTLLRTSSEVGEDGTMDPFSVLAPSVTTPQHVVGAFLAFIFLIHSWPIFKVSLLEVAGFKMFQGECHSGVVFALTLLIAPLVLVALASVPSDIIETVAEIGSDDGASFYDVVDAPSDMFQSQENTFQTFADAAAAAAAAAAAVAAVNHAGSGILYPWEQVLQPAMTVAWTAPLLVNTASQPLSHHGGGGGLGRKRNGGNNNNRVNLMFGDRKYPVVASVGRHGQIYNSSSSSFTTTSSSVSSSKSKALADSGPLVSIYPGVALSFTADVSSVACGCTAALYLVSMPLHDVQDGTCPEADGYCDANLVCGLGCPEVDLFEGSAYDMQVAIHACRTSPPVGAHGHHHSRSDSPSHHQPPSAKEEGADSNKTTGKSGIDRSSGSESSLPAYWPECDGGGCVRKMSLHAPPNSYGPGRNFTIDTTRPFQVRIYFRARSSTRSSSLSRSRKRSRRRRLSNDTQPSTESMSESSHSQTRKASLRGVGLDSENDASGGGGFALNNGFETQLPSRTPESSSFGGGSGIGIDDEQQQQHSGEVGKVLSAIEIEVSQSAFNPLARKPANHNSRHNSNGVNNGGGSVGAFPAAAAAGMGSSSSAEEEIMRSDGDDGLDSSSMRVVRMVIDDAACLRGSSLHAAAQGLSSSQGLSSLSEQTSAVGGGGGGGGGSNFEVSSGIDSQGSDVRGSRHHPHHPHHPPPSSSAVNGGDESEATGQFRRSLLLSQQPQKMTKSAWSRPAHLDLALRRGQRLTASLWGGAASLGYNPQRLAVSSSPPSSSVGQLLNSTTPTNPSTTTAAAAAAAAPQPLPPRGADHEVCVRRLALRDALERFEARKEEKDDDGGGGGGDTAQLDGGKGDIGGSNHEQKEEENHSADAVEVSESVLRRSLLAERTQGGKTSDSLRRRLGCKWVNWKKQNVCSEGTTTTSNNDLVLAKNGISGNHNMPPQQQHHSHPHPIDTPQTTPLFTTAVATATAAAATLVPQSLANNQQQVVTDVEEFEALAEAAAVRAAEERSRHHPHSPPLSFFSSAASPPSSSSSEEDNVDSGRCCFSGGCDGCSSVARPSNYCSRSHDACERDCEFTWCTTSELVLKLPPNATSSSVSSGSSSGSDGSSSGSVTELPLTSSLPSSSSIAALDEAQDDESSSGDGEGDGGEGDGGSDAAFEPGRCCFFGDGCGAACGSFAEEENFCAHSSHHCEQLCGLQPHEFRWCPFSDDDAEAIAARETRVCDGGSAGQGTTTRAFFSDLTLTGFSDEEGDL